MPWTKAMTNIETEVRLEKSLGGMVGSAAWPENW